MSAERQSRENSCSMILGAVSRRTFGGGRLGPVRAGRSRPRSSGGRCPRAAPSRVRACGRCTDLRGLQVQREPRVADLPNIGDWPDPPKGVLGARAHTDPAAVQSRGGFLDANPHKTAADGAVARSCATRPHPGSWLIVEHDEPALPRRFIAARSRFGCAGCGCRFPAIVAPVERIGSGARSAQAASSAERLVEIDVDARMPGERRCQSG